MSNASQAGPGDKELKKLGSLGPVKFNSADHTLVKSKGGGLGSAGRNTRDDRARSAQEQAAEEDQSTAEMIKANTPGPETAPIKPKATLKKVGWMSDKTTFKSDAEVYAEFEIPPAIADRTLVEFELFRKEIGGFKPISKAQAHMDGSGRAKAVFPVPAGEEAKATFAIKVKHCSADWSSGQGTEREVTETAEISIEHTQVSGIHFPKGKSFIADIYLDILCEVKKTYLEWKKTHDKAQIVVYGHTESDEQDDTLNVSRNRAMSAFLFVTGDIGPWADLAEKERWGVWEQQSMLRALGFLKEKPTGNLGPKTRQAIQDFIAFLNEARGKTINPMLNLSEAYIRKELYREYLNLKRSEIGLPNSAFRLVSGYPYVGCRAFNRYQSADGPREENRRVVFLILQESPNFPALFPCRSTTGPCETECKKAGERSTKGFQCKFYDEMVKQEKTGEPVNALAEKSSGKFERLSFDGYSGRGYLIKDFEKFKNAAIQLDPIEVRDPAGEIPANFNNQCVSFVRYFGLPQTKTWKKGPRVCDFKPGELPKGVVIATLRDGVYYSDSSGRSHVGIYIKHDAYQSYLESRTAGSGVVMMDQYHKAAIDFRLKKYAVDADADGRPAKKPWADSEGVVHKNRVKWVDDGEEYFVVMSEQ